MSSTEIALVGAWGAAASVESRGTVWVGTLATEGAHCVVPLLVGGVVPFVVAAAQLVVIGQTRVLVTADKSIVHCLEAGALALQAWEGHQLPLLDEEVATILARLANLLKLFAHKLALRVTDTL